MEKIDVLGSLLHYDSKTMTATFRFDFVDNNLIEQIENLLQHKTPIKLTFKKVKPFRSKTYQQQKKFWVDIHKILKALDIQETKENLDQFYSFIKNNIFPAKKSYVGYNSNGNKVFSVYAPEMKDLSVEEMAKVIEDLHTYYSYLKIDWDKKE